MSAIHPGIPVASRVVVSLFAETSPSVTHRPQDSDSSQVADREASDVLYSEDLAVGDTWESDVREISGEDVATFAGLTGDHDPLHSEDAGASPYGKPIVHGLLGLSVLAGLGTNYPKAATLTFMGIEDWQFLAPVFFGDSVKVRNEVVGLEQHGRRAMKVRWLRQLINETGRVVQEGHFLTLVANRTRVRKRPPLNSKSRRSVSPFSFRVLVSRAFRCDSASVVRSGPDALLHVV